FAQPNGKELAQHNGDKAAQPNGNNLLPAPAKLPQSNGDTLPAASVRPSPPGNTGPAQERPAALRTTSMLGSPRRPEPPPPKPAAPAPVHPSLDPRPTSTTTRRPTGTLDLDQVINEYLKRNNEQGKLDLKVITPSIFIAGKNVGLRVQVLFNAIVEPEAVVTIKIIGTAFKPQVYIGR